MNAVVAVLFFIIGTVAMVTFYTNEILLFVVMGSAVIVILAIDKWKRTNHFLIAMLVGGACENIAVFLGAWNYTNANYLFAPIWLPVGWGMAVVLLEEAFSTNVPVVFSKRSIALAFGGTVLVGLNFSYELGILMAFAIITIILFTFGYYKRSEVKIGIFAAVFGTVMETSCIIAGNWHYSAAMLGTPLWLPLCWFNAFLIMRRVIRLGN
ncbi:hypothetical protein KKB44_06295 [Candidatus Micrarchaeota archaeon]|nr:hypothetical protein [Candidatus Micrarchaeota archaeon]